VTNTTASARYDVSQHAREGGIASGLSRRLRPQRELEAKIAATKNGQAIYHLLRLRLAREQELQRQRLEADRQLVELEQFAGVVREQLDETLAEQAHAQAELERLEARLEQCRSDDDALGHLLRDVGEQRLEVVLGQLGWLEGSDAPAS
jgi:hypothetical protein